MSLVLVEYYQGIAEIVLNRPDKLNAFSRQLIDDLIGACVEVRREILAKSVKVVLLRSATPKAFAAGADLKERAGMGHEEVSKTLSKLREMVDGVAALRVPTIAVLEGLAFGGGLELALACDLRVAHPEAKLGLTEVSLGIIPGAGGTQRLPRLIGEARAKEMIFLSSTLTGQQAEVIGLVNICHREPLQQARQWAQRICQQAPMALVAAKQALTGRSAKGLREALDWERECYEIVLHTHDREEGLRAFLEKRPPVYRGE